MPPSRKKTQEIVAALCRAYNAEIETVANYISSSVNPDGVRAEQVKESLAADIQAELGHARALAQRINTIGGVVPGSMALRMSQKALQPPKDSTDITDVIKGVIAAEEDAVAMYQEIIDLCDGVDYATQDLAIKHLADEQGHLREFIGFLREYQKKR